MLLISRTLLLSFLIQGTLVLHCARAADFSVGNSGSTDYIINGASDPTLTLVRGRTYTFAIAASGHPFWIKTNGVTGTSAAYTAGVTGNGLANGTLTFAVPLAAPNSLFYICEFHSNMRGTLNITNPPPARALLSNPRVPAPGQFRFDVAGTERRLHVIEASTNLSSGWFPIDSNTPPTGTFTFTDPNAGASETRLYRVLTR